MAVCSDCTINQGTALQSPYYTCSACEADYDDETFYRLKQERREGLHANPQRKRRYDTICVGCRRNEEDELRGHHLPFDPRSVAFHRLVEKGQWTTYHHAKTLQLPPSELRKHGWIAAELAERILKLPRRGEDQPPHCPYCKWPFTSLADITFDIRVPANGLSAAWNTEWACNTCQQGKKRFTTEREIEFWVKNWDRWQEHAQHATQPLLFTARAIALAAPPLVGGPRAVSAPTRVAPRIQLSLLPTTLCWSCGTDRGGAERCPKCGKFEAPD